MISITLNTNLWRLYFCFIINGEYEYSNNKPLFVFVFSICARWRFGIEIERRLESYRKYSKAIYSLSFGKYRKEFK